MEQSGQIAQQDISHQSEGHEGLGGIVQRTTSKGISYPPPGTNGNQNPGSFSPPELNLTASPMQAKMDTAHSNTGSGDVMQATKNSASSNMGSGSVIQRKLEVDVNSFVPMEPGEQGPPLPLTIATQNILDELCPEGGFEVDNATGAVTATRDLLKWPGVPYAGDMTQADLTSTPESCKRMMAVINDDNTTTIDFRPGGPAAGPGSTVGPGPGHDGVETDAAVHIDPRFQGQYRINGVWVDVPFYLLFAHELFGHALPKMEGNHVHRGPQPAGGTAPQEVHAVEEERVIAREHGQPERPDDYSGAARQRPN